VLSFLRDSLLSFCFSYTKNILYGVESLFFCLISFLAYLLDTVCYKLNEMEKRFCSNCGHDFNLD